MAANGLASYLAQLRLSLQPPAPGSLEPQVDEKDTGLKEGDQAKWR